ncbi:Nn.00g021370.m01.CDS01 [Neocucurbitaria sp. VM-36]
MALTRAQIAGIVVAFFIVVTLTLVAGITIYRYRNRAPDKPPDDTETPVEPEEHLPGPTNSDARRTNPQTFYDWVRSSNTSDPRSSSTAKSQPQQQGHDRFPSLEHGPGPVIHSRPTVAHRSTMPNTAPNLERSASGDSIKASSLRQAVLDIGNSKQQGESKKEKKEEKEVRPRGYTGAWP